MTQISEMAESFKNERVQLVAFKMAAFAILGGVTGFVTGKYLLDADLPNIVFETLMAASLAEEAVRRKELTKMLKELQQTLNNG